MPLLAHTSPILGSPRFSCWEGSQCSQIHPVMLKQDLRSPQTTVLTSSEQTPTISAQTFLLILISILKLLYYMLIHLLISAEMHTSTSAVLSTFLLDGVIMPSFSSFYFCLGPWPRDSFHIPYPVSTCRNW